VRARLLDFGLARHVDESESLHLTRTGAIMGTPLYLSPEQGGGPGTVDPRSDVYSMGATLFHMLAGQPPFLGETPLALISKHCNEPPPPLAKLNPAVSPATCQVIEKALAKQQAHRHADAAALLADLERLLRGEPIEIAAHPRLPQHDPRRLLQYDFEWQLQSSPEQLWPLVSDTERLNRAIGLPAVQFNLEADSSTGKEGTAGAPGLKSRARRFGRVSKLGVDAVWEEHPFEWVEGRRFGVLREFQSGPFRWLLSSVQLQPSAGGTRLQHSIRVEPSGLVGRALAAVEIGRKARRGLDRVYRRIDRLLSAGDPAALASADPFEDPATPGRSQQRQLEKGLDSLISRGVNPSVVQRLGEYLMTAPPQEVARIRPLALARRLNLDPDALVSACLQGVREGLLVLLWDLLCPICRIPSEVQQTLRQLKGHGRCEVCQINYELDFASAVELIFRVDPAIREADTSTYCIGGPSHSPHVVAQVRLAGHERLELPLHLTEGAYRLRGPQLPESVDVRVEPGAPVAAWEVDLARMSALRQERAGLPLELRPGGQVLTLVNNYEQEVIVRVERTAARDDALTAARASALGLFRELFPGEVLSPGQLIRVSTVTLLWTDLSAAMTAQEKETEAFGLLNAHLQALDGIARREGGTLIKAIGDGGLAAFHTPAAGLRAALGLAQIGPGVRMRAALHCGPALAATLNDHLDYFGSTVRQVAALSEEGREGELLVSQAVFDDPQAVEVARQRGTDGVVERVALPGEAGAIVHRFAGVW
jgi:class 3 adenylate cyclase